MWLPKTAFRNRITRRVVLLAPPRFDKAGRHLRSNAERLRAMQSHIARTAEIAIRELEAETNATFPKVGLEIELVPAETVSLGDLVLNIGSPASIRAAISFLQTGWSERISPAVSGAMSHLIVVWTTAHSEPHGWYPVLESVGSATSVPTVRVNTSIDRLPSLITDILIGVAAFYSWPILRSRENDLEFRRAFSRQKARVAQELRLGSFYGKINGELPYFCFASAARSPDKIDWHRFETAWAATLRPFLVDTQSHNRAVPRDQIVGWVRKTHYRAGQLGLAVDNELLQLPPGRYVLTCIRRKPKGDAAKQRILALFGSPIHVMKHRIVPRDHILAFLKSQEWLDFFPFEVE